MSRPGILSSIFGFLDDVQRARIASIEYERLRVLNLTELNARGLRRDDLARVASERAFGRR